MYKNREVIIQSCSELLLPFSFSLYTNRQNAPSKKNLCREQDEDFVIPEKGLREALHNEGISICDDGINLKKIRYKNSFLRCICIPKDVMRSIADDDKMPEPDLPFGPGIVEEAPEQLTI